MSSRENAVVTDATPRALIFDFDGLIIDSERVEAWVTVALTPPRRTSGSCGSRSNPLPLTVTRPPSTAQRGLTAVMREEDATFIVTGNSGYRKTSEHQEG